MMCDHFDQTPEWTMILDNANLFFIVVRLPKAPWRALAVGGAKRSPAMPDLPTVAEAGVPGYEMVLWFGIVAPAKTPAPIVSTLQKQIAGTLKSPEMKSRLAVQGATPIGNTPAEFETFIKAEMAKWERVIKSAGLKVD